MGKSLIHDVYSYFLNHKNYKNHYLKYYIWRKIIKYHFYNEFTTDYYIRKLFDSMLKQDLFIKKINYKKNDTYKINTFRIEEYIDIGYMSFD
tara:strand:- start:2538 stop:2813 length:276 start_codon:yes stop_codon:yes gene_type:complete